MIASHSRTMLVEGRECSDVFRTFKRKVVGRSVYPKCKKTVDNKCVINYNRYLDSNKVFKHMHTKAPYTLIWWSIASPCIERCRQVQLLRSVQLFRDLVTLAVDKFSS
jgi:hypothetical protein